MSTILPNEWRDSCASAPSRPVALPPFPSASSIARTPTSPNEMPFATSPLRAATAYQPRPVAASCLALSPDLFRALSTTDMRPPIVAVGPRQGRKRPSARQRYGTRNARRVLRSNLISRSETRFEPFDASDFLVRLGRIRFALEALAGDGLEHALGDVEVRVDVLDVVV